MSQGQTTPIIDCNTVVGFWVRRQVDSSAEALLKIMDKYGVVRALCVSTTAIFYDYRQGNEETLSIARRSNFRLYPVATVDPREYINCFKEIELRARQGWRLFRFFPDLQGWTVRYAPFRDIAQLLGELKLPFMLPAHATGVATEIAELVGELQVPVILTAVNYNNLSEIISVMKQTQHICIETHKLFSTGAYEILKEHVGVERIAYGSFAPVQYFASSYLPLIRSSLTDDEKRKILCENIRWILEAKGERAEQAQQVKHLQERKEPVQLDEVAQ
ncbi:MAG: amidohydrolase family protein [Armatimonadota bacterium]|nr:amidohydrolase family protein [Armatimonadota bacterium]MCX7778479.1 amidohydrolase family protein [Armatimonadota bacterium]MDW8026237.1 amidohydrolase family protein [Armatimonadota bacterium]